MQTSFLSRGRGQPVEPEGLVRPACGVAGRILAELFPATPAQVRRRSKPHLALVAAGYVVAWLAGAALLLARYAGRPPWLSIYAEDLPVYLVEALAKPWHSLFSPYAGYLQLTPRIIGQFVSLLPLRDAAAAFAITGALVASGCALFAGTACAGHVRLPALRVLLGLSVLLLPVALLQIANSGVNTPWYLEMALFWALLWRPPARAGHILAAIVGFAAASSNITALIFVLLVAARLIALPRLREHAVSLGWLAGALLQVPYLMRSGSSGSRLAALATPGQSLSFYGHDVVLPAFGWHLSWVLRTWWDRNNALIAVGGALALLITAILITATPRVRAFTVAAAGFGFVFAVFTATVTWWVTINRVKVSDEPGARYTCLPILLLTAVLIVAADRMLAGRSRLATSAGALALTAILCVGWIPDFRYTNVRDQTRPWAPIAAHWLRTCQHHPDLAYRDSYDGNAILIIPCSRIGR